jgi:hypothetical protein
METTTWSEEHHAIVYQQWRVEHAEEKIKSGDFDPAFIDLRQDTLIWM